MVIMTFITHEFSGGPWTSAVQGPKNVKLFLGDLQGKESVAKSTNGRFLELSLRSFSGCRPGGQAG